MKIEMRGLRRGADVGAPVDSAVLAPSTGDGGSVFALIRISVGSFGSGFVDHRLADLILLAGPVAKINQPATFAAKRKIWMFLRIHRLAADGAAPFHSQRIAQRGKCRKFRRAAKAGMQQQRTISAHAAIRSTGMEAENRDEFRRFVAFRPWREYRLPMDARLRSAPVSHRRLWSTPSPLPSARR